MTPSKSAARYSRPGPTRPIPDRRPRLHSNLSAGDRATQRSRGTQPTEAPARTMVLVSFSRSPAGPGARCRRGLTWAANIAGPFDSWSDVGKVMDQGFEPGVERLGRLAGEEGEQERRPEEVD